MLLILWVLPLTCLEGGYIYSGTLKKPSENLLLIESCQLSEVVQHMASRWQQRIAVSMMPSCDILSFTIFVYPALWGFLGPRLVSSSSFQVCMQISWFLFSFWCLIGVFWPSHSFRRSYSQTELFGQTPVYATAG